MPEPSTDQSQQTDGKQRRRLSQAERHKAQISRKKLAQSQSNERYDKIDQKMDSLIQAIASGQVQNNPQPREESDPIKGASTKELHGYMANKDLIQENPGLIGQIASELAMRESRSEISALRDEIATLKQGVQETVGTTITTHSEENRYTEKAQNLYPDFADRDSDLYQTALGQYQAYVNKHGEEDVKSKPEFIFLAVQEAAEQLGVSPTLPGEANIPDQQTEAKEPDRPQGPPPEALTLGGSDSYGGDGSEGDSISAALEKGDRQAATRSLAESLGWGSRQA